MSVPRLTKPNRLPPPSPLRKIALGEHVLLAGEDARGPGGSVRRNDHGGGGWDAARRVDRTHPVRSGMHGLMEALPVVRARAALAAAVLAVGSAMAVLAIGSAAAAAPGDKPVSVVLVHGAFVDGSGWQAVHDRLEKDGYEVLVVQNPTVTLADDVAAAQRVIAEARHPVILVGHSYGGAVITAAGNDLKVRALVYVAAYAPDHGESAMSLASRPPPPGTAPVPVLPPSHGFVTLDRAKMPASFAADVDPTLTRFMADAQVPWGVGAVNGEVSSPAWRSKPSYYLLTTQDRMIPPALQRFMADRARAMVVEQSSSHAVMLSHPDAVVQLIETAAGAPSER
jgi:pimeloyl-ACP methyl ester carboxylesterase